MNNKNIKIIFPEQIIVGYSQRENYLLSFITFKEKNILRKEKSWNDWRDKKINHNVISNEPISGFKFFGSNKRSSDWFGSGRNMVEIQHPNGFVFEITVENTITLLNDTIVENGEIKSKCLLAWSGVQMSLIKENSDIYQQAVENINRNNIKTPIKNLQLGDYVILQNGVEGIYYGNQHTFIRKSHNLYFNYKFEQFHFIKTENIKNEDFNISKSLKISQIIKEKSIQITQNDAIDKINNIIWTTKLYNKTYNILLVNNEPNIIGAKLTEVKYKKNQHKARYIYDLPIYGYKDKYILEIYKKDYFYEYVLTDNKLSFGFSGGDKPENKLYVHNLKNNVSYFGINKKEPISILFEFKNIKVII